MGVELLGLSVIMVGVEAVLNLMMPTCWVDGLYIEILDYDKVNIFDAEVVDCVNEHVNILEGFDLIGDDKAGLGSTYEACECTSNPSKTRNIIILADLIAPMPKYPTFE